MGKGNLGGEGMEQGEEYGSQYNFVSKLLHYLIHMVWGNKGELVIVLGYKVIDYHHGSHGP